MTTTHPLTLAIYPNELQSRAQWICWRLEQRKGKATKIPINPHTGQLAAVDNSTTWGTFEEALAGMSRWQCQGIGFVFTAGDPHCGIDLDRCLDSSGILTPLATHIVTSLDSYTSYSQSGKGLHILVKGTLPAGRRQGAFGGLYEDGRFFALTGRLYPGARDTIEARQAALTVLHRELFPPPAAARQRIPARPPSLSLTDADILSKMFTARNGAAVRQLWEGDTSGYPSPSEADLALCCHLSFWTGGDAARIDALFRQSGLYREGKWHDRSDYRGRTIGKALECAAFYSPQRAPTLRERAKVWHPTLRDHAVRTSDIMRPWHAGAMRASEGKPWH